MAGLRSATVLKYMISVKEDISYPELILEVHRHIQAEKTSDLEASKLSQDFLLGGKRKIDSQAGPSKTEGNENGNGKKNKAGNGNNENPNNNNRNQAPQNNQVPRFREYTPTTVPVATIYSENEHLGIFTIPPNIRTPVNRHDNTKYCRYHRDISHVTEECQVLKDEIERLIQRGQLRNYVRGNNQQPRPQAQENQQPAQEGEDIEVRTIIGGPATGILIEPAKTMLARLDQHHTRNNGLWHPHKDAIVVSLRIASRKVYKILIDNGSSADILFRSTLNRMNLAGAKFEPIKSALYGFTGDSVSSEGVLNLPIELGTHPCQHIQSVNFVVVDCPSSYNAIIGRPTLNAIRAVTSTYHLLVKFPTVGGIGVLKGDQQESRDIYEAANRPSNVHRINIIEAPGSEVATHPPATIMIGNIEVKLNQV
ncbi:hypothetical protein UlMin_018697 [Ulmus minor]